MRLFKIKLRLKCKIDNIRLTIWWYLMGKRNLLGGGHPRVDDFEIESSHFIDAPPEGLIKVSDE